MIGSLIQPELGELIRQRNFNQLREILCDFPAPDIAEILGDLSADDKAVLLRILPHDLATEVLEHLRKVGRERESLNQLYVVDEKGRLVDSVRLRSLVVAELNTPVAELLDHQFFALRATDDQETAVAAFKKYDRTILPVLDSKDALVGVVTVDDVLDVAEQEATEDIQKMGGMEALDAPYLKIAMLSMVRKRAGWLSILFVSEMFTATAMGYFENELAKAAVLALFVPLILSSGGNSGSQATSLIIRAMAVHDVALREWWEGLRRELGTGFALVFGLA